MDGLRATPEDLNPSALPLLTRTISSLGGEASGGYRVKNSKGLL